MNENARKWVDALRSGKFRQGRGRLATPTLNDGGVLYCCLGVACELYKQTNELEVSKRSRSIAYDDEVYGLPPLVREWLGLGGSAGEYAEGDERDTSLATKNDNGATFNDIADIIESEPPGLFSHD